MPGPIKPIHNLRPDRGGSGKFATPHGARAPEATVGKPECAVAVVFSALESITALRSDFRGLSISNIEQVFVKLDLATSTRAAPRF
jgi:hypothetical protein